MEGGEAAAAMQADVARIAREHGLALVGPNCMGVIDLVANAATYIGDVSPYLPLGGVAGIAQSGSVTDAFVHSGSRVGFSRIISCGSEVVLDVCDYLAYCLDDPATSSVILFVEGFKRPERFLALADRALELGKPIMAVKVGRSQQAQVAAIAHSGSLGGRGARHRRGPRRRRVSSSATTSTICWRRRSSSRATRRTGRAVGRGRTGVVTVSTGEASLIADQAPQTGIDLPPLPEAARAAILAALPTMGYVANPLDPWGAAEPAIAYGASFEAMAASGAYDVLAIVHDFPYRSLPSEVATANDVTPAAARGDAPPALDPAGLRVAHLRRAAARDEGAPRHGGRRARRCCGAVSRHSPRSRNSPAGRRVATCAARSDRGGAGGPPWPRIGRVTARTRSPCRRPARPPRPLSERDSLAFLGAAGIAVTTSIAVRDASEAVTAARRLGRPVALKLEATGLVHKSEVGGVALGLADDDAVYVAALSMLENARQRGLAVRGLLVQPMAPPGVELILGLRRDPLFGASVLVGLGGVLTEVLDDVAIRLAPVTPRVAMSMLDDLRGRRVLDGVRGRRGIDRAAIAEMLVALGRLGAERKDVLEVDLNPVIALPSGALAVDALVVLEEDGDAG